MDDVTCPFTKLESQLLWWRQTLRFWNGLAALPVGSFYHTVCLDNLTDAFQGGACNMASSVAGCLSSVGYDMPRVFDVIPVVQYCGGFDCSVAGRGQCCFVLSS